jgi:hypothetical protein
LLSSNPILTAAKNAADISGARFTTPPFFLGEVFFTIGISIIIK